MHAPIDYDRYKAIAKAQRAEAKQQLPATLRAIATAIAESTAPPLAAEAR